MTTPLTNPPALNRPRRRRGQAAPGADRPLVARNSLLGQILDSAVLASSDMLTEDELGDLTRFQTDPVRFAREILGVRLWLRQREILEDLVTSKRVTVRAARGVGKTKTMAVAVAWLLLCFPQTVIVTSAPSWEQVVNILWREVHQLYAEAPIRLPGQIKETEWELGPKWFAIGRSTNRSERFAGFHASPITDPRWELDDEAFWKHIAEATDAGGEEGGFMAVFFDEASGIDERMYETAAGFGTTRRFLMFLASNPTQTAGTFFKSHQIPLESEIAHLTPEQRSAVDWRRHKISSFDVLEHAPRLIDPGYIERARQDWGQGSPMWQIHVEGEFPSEGPNSLFPYYLLEAAKDRETDFMGEPLKGLEKDRDGKLLHRPVFGIDFGASEGEGETVVVVGRGDYLLEIHAWHEADTKLTEEKIHALAERWRPRLVKADATVMGGPICGNLRMGNPTRPNGPKHRPLPVLGINFGEGATDKTRYVTRRDEIFMQAHQRVKEGRFSITPGAFTRPWDKMKAQLAPFTWHEDSRAKIRIVTKEDLRKLGERWDHADAFVIWACKDGAGGSISTGENTNPLAGANRF